MFIVVCVCVCVLERFWVSLTAFFVYHGEHSLKELPFLDILVKNVNDKIITDIYHIPTDTQQYLHFKSHPPKAL